MPRGRDRGFLDGMELWRPRTTTSKAAYTAYVAIARTLEQIDRAMRDEIQEDILRCILSESYVEDLKKGTSHTSSEADTFAHLTDTRCVTAWSRVHTAVLEHQGRSDLHQLLPWTQAKARALEILNLAQAVLEYYDSDECRDLVIPGREGVGAGIEAKLRTLLLFDSIYSRPTYEDAKKNHKPSSHPLKLKFNDFLFARKQNSGVRRKEGSARTHQNRDAILVTITAAAIAISAIPLGLGFHTSTNDAPGSTSDTDFWLLIQNSLMQVLGLATTSLISLVPRPGKQQVSVWPRFLIWIVAILGLGCALFASLLYVRAPPMYSALMSSMASAAQACMVVQLALFVNAGGKGAKMD